MRETHSLQNTLETTLHGIIPPLVTPLRDCDALDVAGLERLVEHVLAGGVHGLFVLGTTGEGPSLSYRLRRELIERVSQQVAGRVPLVVGITDTAFVESVELARFAANHGVAAVVAAPPYYLPPDPPELVEYFTHLAEAVPLPLVLYNMPGCTKVNFTLQTVARLMDLPNVTGLKDSSGDMTAMHRLVQLRRERDRDDFALLIGPEELLGEAVLFGADGGVSGGANFRPRLYVDVYDAAKAGNLAVVRQLHEQVLALGQAVYSVGRHRSAIIKGLKGALACEGICDDFLAEPFHRFRSPERGELQTHLDRLALDHPVTGLSAICQMKDRHESRADR